MTSSRNWLRAATRAAALIHCLCTAATAAAPDLAELAPADERFGPAADATAGAAPNFQRHVIPLLGRLGCNGRACHGSFQGQAGFRLSMFGYDFAADHEALTAGDAPRVDVADPAASLILNKPTNEDEHGGGQRYEPDGWEYHLLRRWIESGANEDSRAAGQLVSLDVTPRELRFDRVGQEVQLRAVAVWADGTREDVTCLTRFSSNDESVAEVAADGLVRAAARGHTFIISRYDNGVTATESILPLSDIDPSRFAEIPTPTPIDRLVVAQLQKLGIEPSSLCTDEEFLRRATLDITGTLPTVDEITAFLADRAADKRERLIDELLSRPTYSMWWGSKLCDVTGLNGAGELGATEFAPLAGQQWQHWLKQRVAANAGWGQIARGILLATSRRAGQTYDDYVAEQTSYLRAKDPVDFATRETMPYYWFRARVQDSEQKALAVAYTFLGVRLECAQCHKHPFDQWSQRDFQQFTAFFERVDVGHAADAIEPDRRLQELVGTPRFKNAAERRKTYRRMASAGQVVPWREVYVQPVSTDKSLLPAKLLGGEEVPQTNDEDPRAALAEWMLSKDNPYFARAFVNRVWAHYFGAGIVNPPDDANLGNPPVNRELLDYLAGAFADHDFDMRWLHREITTSQTYQRSWRPTGTNRGDETHFSRAVIRRLPAEVVIDALALATAATRGVRQATAATPARTIGHVPTPNMRTLPYGLAVFGRPLNLVNCDCERQSTPSLMQSIFLRNDEEIWRHLDRDDGWLAELKQTSNDEQHGSARAAGERADDGQMHDEWIRLAYLRTVSREPTPLELARCRQRFAASTAEAAQRDVLWALLNTQEFVTNH